MEKYPKEVHLKSRETIIIRLMEKDDLDVLIDFFQALPREDRMYLRSDVKQKENVIKRFGTLDPNIRFPLLAFHEDQLIAIGSLYRAEFGWTRHLGEIRIVVAPKFQRKGVSTILVKELFFYAISTDLYKLQAEIMENQTSAISAFEHMGFKKEAILHKHVTDINGDRQNLVIMSLDIKELWYLMEDFIHDKMYVT
ncbi:GNAT family N-acetyltransferase [Calditrichota bacterium]